MKPNIFWRCARRQPIRTVLLLLLVVGVVFAFTARAAEYLLLRQETERLGSYYKAVGGLSTLGGGTDAASFDEAKAFLENDPRVAYTAWNEQTSAVLQSMYNADILGYNTNDVLHANYYFTGTLLGIAERRGDVSLPVAFTENGDWGLCCYFRQEQVFSGAPELVWEGRIVQVNVPAEDAPAVLQALTVGKKYLVCGRPTLAWSFTDDILIRKSNARDLKPSRTVFYPAIMEFVEGGFCLTTLPLAKGAPLFYAVPESGEIDWSDPALTGVQEEVQICRDELSAMSVYTSSDMSTISRAMGLYEIYLVEGRWLDHEDDAAQSRVCVIHEEMAKIRGLAIGDTIALTLRDVETDLVDSGYIMYDLVGKVPPYETATETFQIVGTFNTVRPDEFGYTSNRNTLYIPTSTLPESFHSYHDNHLHATNLRFILTSQDVIEAFLADTSDALADMGLQASMRDSGWDTFQQAVQPMLRSSLYNLVIFALVLLTALCLVAFLYLRARRKDMAIARALGVPAGVCVRQGALPLAVIGLIGTLGGAVVGWQYALGRGASTLAPLGALGEAATEAAAEVETAAAAVTLPWYWLAAIFGGVFGLCLLLALGGMAYLSRKPVLELLQGGSAPARQKEQAAARLAALDAASKTAGAGTAGAMSAGAVTGAAGAMPAGTMPAGGGAAISPQPAGRSRGVAHTLRFVGCYIRRSAVKSTLVLLLAVLFTVGLAAIRIAILRSGAEIDGLYDSTSVPMNLVPENSASYVMGGGFVPQKTINAVYDTGFVRDAYLEGQCAIMRLRREDVYLQDLNGTASQPALREGDIGQGASSGAAAWILSFDDLEEFMTVGSGAGGADADSADAEKIEITYWDGWDASMFAQDYADSDVLPVLLPADLCEMLHVPADGRLALTVLWESQGMTNVSLVQVAGVYTGSLPLESDGSYLLAPSGVMDAVMDGHTAYSTARFALDPAYNRELDGVRATLDEIVQEPDAGLFPLRAVVQDEELKQAIEPLENSIQLMKTLFPVALALSLLAALGVSALLILTEAREAAIMRVLGTTKLRSRIILSLQVIFMVLAGLMIGLTVAFTWAGSLGLAWATAGLSLLCAAAYLLCATAGSAAGAVTVTNRPPLELLQVKE